MKLGRIDLSNADARRGLRSVVQMVVMLALLAMAWRLIGLLADDAAGLRMVAYIQLGIIGFGTVAYGFENGVRAFKLTFGKASIDIGGGE